MCRWSQTQKRTFCTDIQCNSSSLIANTTRLLCRITDQTPALWMLEKFRLYAMLPIIRQGDQLFLCVCVVQDNSVSNPFAVLSMCNPLELLFLARKRQR